MRNIEKGLGQEDDFDKDDFDMEKFAEANKEMWLNKRESAREKAGATEREVAEQQAVVWETTALVFQERVNDEEQKTELANSMSGLLKRLEQHSGFSPSGREKPLPHDRVEKLIEFLKKTEKELGELYTESKG